MKSNKAQKMAETTASHCNQYRYEKFVEEDLINVLISISRSLAIIADKLSEADNDNG